MIIKPGIASDYRQFTNAVLAASVLTVRAIGGAKTTHREAIMARNFRPEKKVSKRLGVRGVRRSRSAW